MAFLDGIIDTNHFKAVSLVGYNNKDDAYDDIRAYYQDVKGVTTFQGSDGLWYIVQSNVLANI